VSRAPLSVLPSKEITFAPSSILARNHIHAHQAWSRASAVRRCGVRRIVFSLGAPHPSPSLTSRDTGVWAAHSPIAVNDFAPARVAASATARMEASRKRRPRRQRGSATSANISSNPAAAAKRGGSGPRSSSSTTAESMSDDEQTGTARFSVVGVRTAIFQNCRRARPALDIAVSLTPIHRSTYRNRERRGPAAA
jgi:hypothetical protein